MEANAEFQKRINRETRTEEEDVPIAEDVAWTLGSRCARGARFIRSGGTEPRVILPPAVKVRARTIRA